MRKLHYRFAILLLAVCSICTSPTFAGWGKFTLTDDNGEQVTVKHGLFGKKTIVKDRWGDGFEHNRSIFGLTKDTKVSAIGNDVHVHKGLFGFSKTQGQDMLGDTVTASKNPLFHNTNVNLSGVNGLLDKYLGPKKLNSPPVDPSVLKQGLNDPAQNFKPSANPDASTPFPQAQNY